MNDSHAGASELRLPAADGSLSAYRLVGEPLPIAKPARAFNRVAFSAAHVVADPFTAVEPSGKPVLDWPRTIAYRRHLIGLGLGIAEAMDTAQRGMGLDWNGALELIEQTPNSWMPQQFENPANIEVHHRTTAQEILKDFADSPIDVLITGVGTGGHITGVAEVLKKEWPNIKVYAVEPTLSPVISGGQPGPHPIQGLAAGFIPANLHTQLLDGVIQVEANDAADTANRDKIRAHLTGIAEMFQNGDFKTPFAVHSRIPPGVPEMEKLKAEIRYAYEETGRGARVRITTANPEALAAVHRFLKFQIEDHRTGDATSVND